MTSLPINIKDNKVPTFGLIISYAILPFISFLSVWLTSSLLNDTESTGFIAGLFGIGLLSFIVGIANLIFFILWSYNAHKNAEEIAEEDKLLPWPAWATVVFGILPITNFTLFPYAIYKIIQASRATQFATVGLYGYVAVSLIIIAKLGYDLADIFSQFGSTEQAEADIVSLSIDSILQLVLIIFSILFIYFIYKAQQKIAESTD